MLEKRHPSSHEPDHLALEPHVAHQRNFLRDAYPARGRPQSLAVSSCMSLQIDVYRHLEAADICTSTPQSVEAPGKVPHTIQSPQDMYQERPPSTGFAALTSARSSLASMQVLKTLTQGRTLRKQHKQEWTVLRNRCITGSGGPKDGPWWRLCRSSISRETISTGKPWE